MTVRLAMNDSLSATKACRVQERKKKKRKKKQKKKKKKKASYLRVWGSMSMCNVMYKAQVALFWLVARVAGFTGHPKDGPFLKGIV